MERLRLLGSILGLVILLAIPMPRHMTQHIPMLAKISPVAVLHALPPEGQCDIGNPCDIYSLPDPMGTGNCDMYGGNICGDTWSSPYAGQIPTDHTEDTCVQNGDCRRLCSAILDVTYEFGGDMYTWFSGVYDTNGKPVYDFENYYPWWGNWGYVNGSGSCV